MGTTIQTHAERFVAACAARTIERIHLAQTLGHDLHSRPRLDVTAIMKDPLTREDVALRIYWGHPADHPEDGLWVAVGGPGVPLRSIDDPSEYGGRFDAHRTLAGLPQFSRDTYMAALTDLLMIHGEAEAAYQHFCDDFNQHLVDLDHSPRVSGVPGGPAHLRVRDALWGAVGDLNRMAKSVQAGPDLHPLP